MRLILAVLLAITASSSPAAQRKSPVQRKVPGQQVQPVQPVQRAELWNSEQFVLHSKILDRDFLIQVAKPFDTVKEKVPAVYITDGNMLFSAAASVGAVNAGDESTGPAYYIGISYPEQDRTTWFRERSAHLTHVQMKTEIHMGDGEKFARFIMQELQPVIERRYPVDPARRVLAGYSFGGLFATHMLLDHPEAFQTYLICSPSIWVEPKLLERARAFDTAAAPKRVFIAIGGDEKPFMLASELHDALNRPGNGLTLKYWSIPDENHMTVPPAFLSRALRFGVPPLPKTPAAAQ